ncbi:unnamed protein product [Hyaloperonospora brassicae]|uniref:RxLR effector candidate protein n=1 Tax=Hyaloperonospora brassicae TaxID=162125 RepID=A0AAV0V0Y2_HYABA|nr:unnamed protein product [Hyaloperonospora brassicae]
MRRCFLFAFYASGALLVTSSVVAPDPGEAQTTAPGTHAVEYETGQTLRGARPFVEGEQEDRSGPSEPSVFTRLLNHVRSPRAKAQFDGALLNAHEKIDSAAMRYKEIELAATRDGEIEPAVMRNGEIEPAVMENGEIEPAVLQIGKYELAEALESKADSTVTLQYINSVVEAISKAEGEARQKLETLLHDAVVQFVSEHPVQPKYKHEFSKFMSKHRELIVREDKELGPKNLALMFVTAKKQDKKLTKKADGWEPVLFSHWYMNSRTPEVMKKTFAEAGPSAFGSDDEAQAILSRYAVFCKALGR